MIEQNDLHKAQPGSVVEPKPAAHRQSALSQDPIDTLDDRGYQARLKNALTKSLSNEKVQTLIPELMGDPGRASAESAVDTLLAMEPVVSITRWTEITAAWFKDLNSRERSLAWGPARDVHLNLGRIP